MKVTTKLLATCVVLALLAIGTVAQAGTTYKLDDGSINDSTGTNGAADFWWGNEFSVVSGAEKITAIQILTPLGNDYCNIGDPFRVLLYSYTDTTDTLNGLTLLQNVSTTLEDTGGPGIFQTIDIPDTIVSGNFVVAAMISTSKEWYGAGIDNTTSAGKSWYAYATKGEMDVDLTNPIPDRMSGNFTLRAQGEAAVPEPATLLGFGLPMLMVGIGKLRGLRK